MRFLETYNGTIININEIAYFDFSSFDDTPDIRVVLKGGDLFSLVEIPDLFHYKDTKIKFSHDHLITYTKCCVLALQSINDTFIDNDVFSTKSWEIFVNTYNEYMQKIEENLMELDKLSIPSD